MPEQVMFSLFLLVLILPGAMIAVVAPLFLINRWVQRRGLTLYVLFAGAIGLLLAVWFLLTTLDPWHIGPDRYGTPFLLYAHLWLALYALVAYFRYRGMMALMVAEGEG
ncbi:hypothetical protein [Fuscovulum blasticum]|uniref:hypothetical protein n=1 Tax=Fuscovulum blasticum TaxID=1075 RepID=UPI000D3E4671|nr:hypothetical protein [Fuscovulum blasticum]AWD21743.1 hypothetical protein B6K69_08695 [Fuscovulum blasticum]